MIGRRAFVGGVAAAGFLAACAGAKRKTSSGVATGGTPSGSGPTTAGPATTSTTRPQGPATFVAHGPATSTGVALTFHTAGDPAITHQILADAARLGAKLTFFLVGNWAEGNPATVKMIVDGGHELGNHTWSHIDMPHLSAAGMATEITKCADVLATQTGSISKYFRPSQTDVPSAAILEQAGKAGYATSVGYDVDPLDYTNPGSSLVVSRTRAKLHGGAFVSLHTLYQGTAVALPQIIEAIHGRGLQPVTVSTVLGA